jgi:hypothetical protein
VNLKNVVPFEASARRTMARRGAPDKTLASQTLEVNCPYCAADLFLDAEIVSMNLEALCSNCRRVIDLGGPETADSRR